MSNSVSLWWNQKNHAFRCVVPWRKANGGRSISTTELGQQANDLEVEPDQGDHQSECAVPFHIFRCTRASATLDQVEVEDQIQGSDDYHDHAETNPDRP